MDIRLIVIDIDGTMTDGSIYYTENGTEIKKFNVKDAAGVLCAQAVGKECMFLTGRINCAIDRRAKDLRVKYVFQGIHDKKEFLIHFLEENDISPDSVLCIGDDLNDIGIMAISKKAACPCDAADEVKEVCNYISDYNGGKGAVRDIIFNLLKEEGLYKTSIERVYGIL